MSTIALPGPAPSDADALSAWIRARLHEPSRDWIPKNARVRELPRPVNLPGMHRAVAALLARYWFMQPEWHADVLQDFSRWLLRPQSAVTIARSALTGLRRGQTATLEAGIAWKLRVELLSQAHRAYKRARRDYERRCALRQLAAHYTPIVREVAYQERWAATVPTGL